jgi:hypothetical protein
METSNRSPEAAPDEPAGTAPREPASPPAAGPAALWSAALAAGLIAAVAAWLIGEAAHEFFQAAKVEQIVDGRKQESPTFETYNDATVKNSLLAFGSLGGLLGMALGAGSGLARRAPLWAVMAAAMGLVLGGLAGAGATAVVLPTALDTRTFDENDLIRPFLVHAGMWAPLGAAGGLAFGLGARRRGSGLAAAAIGGAVGALLGTAAYDLIGGVAFPFAKTDTPISQTWPTRLIARLCVALGTAAGAALSIRDRPAPSRPAAS